MSTPAYFFADAEVRMIQAEQAAAAKVEANHPARLLGVAQAAIRDALLLTDPAEIHAHLTDALDRIKPAVAPDRPVEPRPVLDVQAACTERFLQLEPHGYPEKAARA